MKDFIIEDNTLIEYDGDEDVVIIPKNVTKIRFNSFYDAYFIKIIIHKDVNEIDYGAFEDSHSLEEIIVDEDNKHYKSVDGVLYTKDGKKLITYPFNKPDTEFTVPEGVEEICQTAFRDNEYLSDLILPNSLKK
ncbi:MAG: leucine-rich repeat protein [Abditibacteriota bacterium]|nr:leucine-rich repeat protein [Abditibacteriota bacterium]